MKNLCSPPVVCVEVGSGKTDQRLVEEDADNNHQSSDGVGPPEDREREEEGKWEGSVWEWRQTDGGRYATYKGSDVTERA